MTGREWKPGDVGVNERHGYRGIFVQKCPTHERDCWHNESGFSDPATDIRRPLVVIDPEDREQVERLVRALGLSPSNYTKLTQAALRSLGTPPKPEEPTGLGAVVEDASGQRWTKVGGTGCWVGDGIGLNGRLWREVAAVRVLSEGVTE